MPYVYAILFTLSPLAVMCHSIGSLILRLLLYKIPIFDSTFSIMRIPILHT